MRKYSTFFYLLSLLNVAPLFAQDALNVELFGVVDRGDVRYSGSWAYIAPDGSEYALVGAKTGTAIYPIDDTDNLAELGFVPGPETNWREITVIGHHAFVVTDVQGNGHSMQVINLSFLPDSVSLVTSYTETFTKGHIIQKDPTSDEPYVYVMGFCGSCGVQILDVSDPENPVKIGEYDPGYYIHDAHIRGDLLFGAAFYEYEMDIVDISDKTNPVLIGKITYEGQNTHSSSLSEDGKYLFMCDEQDGQPMRVINVEDTDNPFTVAEYTANPASLVHNPYVRGDFCFVSHNTEGLRVLDVADPALPVEVGFYDTFDGPSGGFSGLWSACPYFPSGKIVGGDRTKGLFVWTFNDTRAARIYGVVRDSVSGQILTNADVAIVEASAFLTSDADGNFKYGMLAGEYSIQAFAEGYQLKNLEVELGEGDSLWVEIELVPEGLSSLLSLPPGVPQIALFPNPSNGHFNMDLAGIKGASQIFFHDQTGRLVYLQNVENQQFIKIENNFPKGKYSAVAKGGKGEILAKGEVVIQ